MKIAACDFDGTLFRDGVVSEADLEAIADWRRSGNAFGIVTGRGRNTLLRDEAVQHPLRLFDLQ